MTPVAGGVADGEENQPILLSGSFERFITPGIPINRVFQVLQQAGAFLILEVIHEHAPFS